MADRFYGTPDLIGLAQTKGCGYRLRIERQSGGLHRWAKVASGSSGRAERPYLHSVELTHKRVVTNIGIIHDRGHDEPWFIAMPVAPGYLTTLDYAARCGIEPIFSDFKLRGLGLEHSQLRTPNRLARLLPVMSMALYSAFSTEISDASANPSVDGKKIPASAQKPEPPSALLVHQEAPTYRKTGPISGATSRT